MAPAAAPAVRAPAQSATTSRLAKVAKGRLNVPLRYVFYGPEGVGKSTLAAHAPSPIWFDIEDGSGRLDVARYSFRDGTGGHVPQSYAEILAAIDDLTTSEHPYQTLVFDTADRLESLIWKFMLARDGQRKTLTSIEDYGYGKGFQIAVDEWRGLCLRLDRLRTTRGMSIILLAHAQIRLYKNPEGEDYDRFHLRINDKAAGFLKEWSDVAGFCCFEEGAGKLGDSRAKGFSTGRRLLKLERTAAYDAKSRIPLPAEVELDVGDPWAPLRKAVEQGLEMGIGVNELAAQIDAEVARIGDPVLTDKVNAAVKVAREGCSNGVLARYLMDLKKRPSAASAAG